MKSKEEVKEFKQLCRSMQFFYKKSGQFYEKFNSQKIDQNAEMTATLKCINCLGEEVLDNVNKIDNVLSRIAKKYGSEAEAISYDYLVNGLSSIKIAEKKNVSSLTIRRHLEKWISYGLQQ